MLRHPRFLAVLAILALASACGPEAPGEAGSSAALAGGRWGEAPAHDSHGRGNKLVTVMTRNLYVGADVNVLIGTVAAVLSDPSLTDGERKQAIATAVSEFWAFVQTTDFPARARLIADEIEDADPDLIGLQELSLFEIGTPRLDPGAPGGVAVDYRPEIDFLVLLEAELTKRGLGYERGPIVANFSGALPDVTGRLIRLTDRDGILVRKGIPTANQSSGHYKDALPLTLPPPLPQYVARGWTMTDANIHGRWLTFFETHLEEELTPEVQVPQAEELIEKLSTVKLPLIAAGDFNAGPQIPKVPTYTNLTKAFTDTWQELRPHSPGFTCCFSADLKGGDLYSRIDLMLLQGAVRPIMTWRVGLDDFTRQPPHLHASDHAGLVSVFRLQEPRSFEVASH